VGALITIIGVLVIVMIHESGHFITAKAFGMKATEYFLGFGPKLWSFRRGETEYGIKAIPAGGYVRIIGMNPMEEIAAEEEHRTYRGKPFWQKSIVVMAGVASHFVLAFLLIYVVEVGIGIPDADLPTLEVAQVTVEVAGRPTAAAEAGIEPGDVVAAVDGRPVAGWEEFTEILRSAGPGAGLVLTVEREGETLDLPATLTPRRDPETGEPVVDPDTGSQIGFLGVSPRFERTRVGPLAGIAAAGSGVGQMTADSVRGIGSFAANFGDFVQGVFTGEELRDEDRPISIIGVAQLGEAGQQEGGVGFTLQLLAFFAVFTGILNAIPLYPFDGGHFAVALYEKVRGRHPDVRKLLPIAAAFFLLLLLIGVVTLFLDIADPIDLG